MVWDCFSVAPSAYPSLKRMGIVNHTPIWGKGHLGQVKTSQPPPPPFRFLPSALLLRLLCAVVCHLVLCWWNAIVLWNRKRGGDYHGLFVTVGTGRRMWVEKGGWLVAFKSDLFEKQQRLLVPGTQRRRSRPKRHNFNAMIKHCAVKRRNGAMRLFFTLNWSEI